MTNDKAARRRPGRRAYLVVTIIAVILVLFPFLFWYGTWFGRRLGDADIDKYLDDAARPRHIQHALVQIGERMARHDGRAARWYPKVVEIARNPHVELRQTAAWIMGQDRTCAPFHEALVGLLRDPEPMVRRNAALGLSNFGDAAALGELRAMLQPFTVTSPADGGVAYRLKAGEYVNPGTLIARVGGAELRSPVPGEVSVLTHRDGTQVKMGEPLARLGPDKNHVWEALRALFSIGTVEDLETVERFARGVPGMPDRVEQQAALTARAIRNRSR